MKKPLGVPRQVARVRITEAGRRGLPARKVSIQSRGEAANEAALALKQLLPGSLSLLAWIISGVNVVDASRPGELDLYDHLLVPGPGKMRMLCRYHIQGARFEHLAFRFIELFAHAEADATADDSDNLCIRMSMRRDLVVGGEFDALDDHLSFSRVAHQDGELGTLWKCRVVLPCQFIGLYPGRLHGILRQCRARQCDQGYRDQKLFHEVLPGWVKGVTA